MSHSSDMGLSENEDQQNFEIPAIEQPRRSSRTRSLSRKTLCVEELSDLRGSKIGLSILKGSKRGLSNPKGSKRGRGNMPSKAKKKPGYFNELDEPEQCEEGNALQQQNRQQFMQPRSQKSLMVKLRSVSGPAPADNAPPPGFSKGARPTEEVKLELCAKFCEESDCLYMGERTQVKKPTEIAKSNIVFEEDGYTSLYQRICLSRGRLEGSLEVNKVIKMQLTQILKVVKEMENIDFSELTEDKLKEWEQIVGIGKYLKFDIDWLHDSLNKVISNWSSRPSLKEAAHTADEQVATLEREVASAKRSLEIQENEYQMTKRYLESLEGKVDSAKANWETLMQAKDGATLSQTEAYARLQQSMTYELKI
ncbi:hypothetical protein ACHQM5_029644 [Ranunculus cassubicifolius]